MLLRVGIVMGVLMVGCSTSSNDDTGSGGSPGSGGSLATGGGSAAGGNSATGGHSGTGGATATTGGGSGTGGGSAAGGGSSTGGSSAADGGRGAIEIAVWTDAAGACPTGLPKKDITTVAELESASRGEGAFAGDAPATCYFIHDATYVQNGTTLEMYIKVGGTDAAHRRVFVGQSRTGVILKGRATIDTGVSHVQIANMTFDLTGYVQSGSFNTLSMLGSSTDLRVDHVDFTGDCVTGANGGHVEVDGSSDVVVEACLIEKFGRCGPAGHQDHGVYLASGDGIVIRNNEIRGNASRGVQLNTNGGDFGTLANVTIERNRIHDNGHADYEDGIVMNATATGTISNVIVQHNLLYANYYSGLRVVGDAFVSIRVEKNTFFHNGSGSTATNRSEANIDAAGSGANTVFTKNILSAGNAVINDCYDAQSRGYLLNDNVVQGSSPAGTAGNCITSSVSADPMFVNSATFDFHTQNAAAAGYGAYAP